LTVQDLIAKLQEMPQDAVVKVKYISTTGHEDYMAETEVLGVESVRNDEVWLDLDLP
jgi:hypothetical protein